jgi:hypothetical protein
MSHIDPIDLFVAELARRSWYQPERKQRKAERAADAEHRAIGERVSELVAHDVAER